MKFTTVETPIGAHAKEALEKAISERKPVGLWLNKYGEQITVTLDPGESDESDVIDLGLEMSGSKMSGPSFPVCIAIRGRLVSDDGDPMSIADLGRAIKAAEAERIRFYTERAEAFGPSAWPGGSRNAL
jgi:hypothetical protein